MERPLRTLCSKEQLSLAIQLGLVPPGRYQCSMLQTVPTDTLSACVSCARRGIECGLVQLPQSPVLPLLLVWAALIAEAARVPSLVDHHFLTRPVHAAVACCPPAQRESGAAVLSAHAALLSRVVNGHLTPEDAWTQCAVPLFASSCKLDELVLSVVGWGAHCELQAGCRETICTLPQAVNGARLAVCPALALITEIDMADSRYTGQTRVPPHLHRELAGLQLRPGETADYVPAQAVMISIDARFGVWLWRFSADEVRASSLPPPSLLPSEQVGPRPTAVALSQDGTMLATAAIVGDCTRVTLFDVPPGPGQPTPQRVLAFNVTQRNVVPVATVLAVARIGTFAAAAVVFEGGHGVLMWLSTEGAALPRFLPFSPPVRAATTTALDLSADSSTTEQLRTVNLARHRAPTRPAPRPQLRLTLASAGGAVAMAIIKWPESGRDGIPSFSWSALEANPLGCAAPTFVASAVLNGVDVVFTGVASTVSAINFSAGSDITCRCHCDEGAVPAGMFGTELLFANAMAHCEGTCAGCDGPASWLKYSLLAPRIAPVRNLHPHKAPPPDLSDARTLSSYFQTRFRVSTIHPPSSDVSGRTSERRQRVSPLLRASLGRTGEEDEPASPRDRKQLDKVLRRKEHVWLLERMHNELRTVQLGVGLVQAGVMAEHCSQEYSAAEESWVSDLDVDVAWSSASD